MGGDTPHTEKSVYHKAFFYSVKPLSLEEEKDKILGSEPVV